MRSIVDFFALKCRTNALKRRATNSEDKKTKVILVLKACLKICTISQSKYEN